MTILPPLLRTLCKGFLIATCCIFLNAYGDNGTAGTGIAKINGVGGTGIRGIELTEEQKKAIKAEKARQEAEEKRKNEVKREAAEIKKRNDDIIQRRKSIYNDHNLKKNSLQIECRRRTTHLQTQFQKRLLDSDATLRQRLNALPRAMSAKDRVQAESKLRSNFHQQKRTITSDNKSRQVALKRQCSDQAKSLEIRFKQRVQDFERKVRNK